MDKIHNKVTSREFFGAFLVTFALVFTPMGLYWGYFFIGEKDGFPTLAELNTSQGIIILVLALVSLITGIYFYLTPKYKN